MQTDDFRSDRLVWQHVHERWDHIRELLEVLEGIEVVWPALAEDFEEL